MQDDDDKDLTGSNIALKQYSSVQMEKKHRLPNTNNLMLTTKNQIVMNTEVK